MWRERWGCRSGGICVDEEGEEGMGHFDSCGGFMCLWVVWACCWVGCGGLTELKVGGIGGDEDGDGIYCTEECDELMMFV